MCEQRKNLERVSQKIAGYVLSFCTQRMASGNTRFYMRELTRHVSTQIPTAPDSAGRILRDLKQKGLLNYRVVSRKDSHYEILPAQPPPTEEQAVESVSLAEMFGWEE